MADKDEREQPPPLVVTLTPEEVARLTDQKVSESERLKELAQRVEQGLDQRAKDPNQQDTPQLRALRKETEQFAGPHAPERPDAHQHRPSNNPTPAGWQIFTRRWSAPPPQTPQAPTLQTTLQALQQHPHALSGHGVRLEFSARTNAPVPVRILASDAQNHARQTEARAQPTTSVPDIDRKIAEARDQLHHWRDQLIALHKQGYAPAAREVTERAVDPSVPSPPAPQPRSPNPRGNDTGAPTLQQLAQPLRAPDERFAQAALNPQELDALAKAKDGRDALRLLGELQQSREQDHRIPTISNQHPHTRVLDRIIPINEQHQLGLRPTPHQLNYLQNAATLAEEQRRTMDFLGQRQAANAYWLLRAYTAERRGTGRGEQTDRRQARSQQRSEATRAWREASIERDHSKEHGPSRGDQGGRGRG